MVTINNARKILQRVDTLPLYLHAYAFHFKYGWKECCLLIYLISQVKIIYVASKSMFWMASVFLSW